MPLGKIPFRNYASKRQLQNFNFKSHNRISPFVLDFAFNSTKANVAAEVPAPLNTSVCGANQITPSQNAQMPRNQTILSLPTPVKAESLSRVLEGYDPQKLQFLIEGFSQGFRLGCVGLPTQTLSRNHKSTSEYPSVIEDFIDQGINKGRIAGPFPSPPFEFFISSPLGVVPKSEAGKFRVIHDLSFPKHNSVNSQIPQECATVQYDSIDNVTSLLRQFGKDSLMAKTDIQDAFRIVPINPEDYKLLGFSWQGLYYYDKCLPMGASSSCQIFESLSKGLQWAMCTKFNAAGMSHMIDDFFFIGPKDSDKCLSDLQQFLAICSEAGIPIKGEKTHFPTRILTIYGIEVDSSVLECRLPEQKLVKIRNKLQEVKHRKKITLKELQSLIGLLNFACLVVVPGRAFLRRIIDLTCGVSNPSHFIRLTCETRSDLQMWSHFIENYNGKSVILPDVFTSSDKALLFTDASGSIGFAGVLGTEWFALGWDVVSDLEHHQIAIKELFPIVLALEVWGPSLANKKILFMSDNEAIVHVLNKQSCKEKTLMKLIRRLVLTSLSYNIYFKAKHIAGKKNVLADKLSRFQFQEAFKIAPHLNADQTAIPVELLNL